MTRKELADATRDCVNVAEMLLARLQRLTRCLGLLYAALDGLPTGDEAPAAPTADNKGWK